MRIIEILRIFLLALNMGSSKLLVLIRNLIGYWCLICKSIWGSHLLLKWRCINFKIYSIWITLLMLYELHLLLLKPLLKLLPLSLWQFSLKNHIRHLRLFLESVLLCIRPWCKWMHLKVTFINFTALAHWIHYIRAGYVSIILFFASLFVVTVIVFAAIA